MIDLKVVKPKDFAKIKSADYLSEELLKKMFLAKDGESFPIVLMLEGENFHRATDVVLNGHQLEYTLLSPTKIIAQVTPSLASQDITSLYVLTDKESFAVSSVLSFEFGAIPELMSGMTKVIAQFTKVMLTTPGTDTFDKGLGGGAQQFAGSTTKSPHTILAQAAMLVTRTADQIKSRQLNSSLPNDEKLKSVEILSLDFSRGDSTSIDMKIRLSTYAETGFPISLELGAQDLAANT